MDYKGYFLHEAYELLLYDILQTQQEILTELKRLAEPVTNTRLDVEVSHDDEYIGLTEDVAEEIQKDVSDVPQEEVQDVPETHAEPADVAKTNKPVKKPVQKKPASKKRSTAKKKTQSKKATK
jgi:hypothetical protein